MTIVLSKWVLATGRVMPELPEKLANKCLGLLNRVGWDEAPFTLDERREILEAVTTQMVREFGLVEKACRKVCGASFGLPDPCEFPRGHEGPCGFMTGESP